MVGPVVAWAESAKGLFALGGGVTDPVVAGSVGFFGGRLWCGGEVAVEVKLATNQLTLLFGSFQLLASLAWLLVAPANRQHAELSAWWVADFVANRYEKLTLTKQLRISDENFRKLAFPFENAVFNLGCKISHSDFD